MKAPALFPFSSASLAALIGMMALAPAALAQSEPEGVSKGMSTSISGGLSGLQSAGSGWRQAGDPVAPGLQSAQLLPGWELPNGNRMVALELQLEPGWKTYWRSPGDTGLPPSFDWTGSENLGEVAIHWPRPELIASGGEVTLGYHRSLILPIEITPAQIGDPVVLRGSVDFGLCLDICVPGHAQLEVGPPKRKPDPRILAALEQVPIEAELPLACKVQDIADGMRVSATIALPGHPDNLPADTAVAIELDGAHLWVSQPETRVEAGRLIAVSDLIDETGKPFALNPAQLRVTLISAAGAVEFRGCDSLD